MTVLEEQMREEFRRFGVSPVPAGRDPDVYVFGDWYPCGRHQGWGDVRCRAHQAGWKGELTGCWCCAAGIKPQ